MTCLQVDELKLSLGRRKNRLEFSADAAVVIRTLVEASPCCLSQQGAIVIRFDDDLQ